MNANRSGRAVSLLIAIPVVLTAQPARYRDPVMLKNWAAPLYWQPTQAQQAASDRPLAAGASLPVGTNALVFVAMAPCRIADTRTGLGFSGAFGPPSLDGSAVPGRTFPIQSNTTCPIPSIAQAYSFNLTVVAPAPFGFITAYPTPGPLPLAATVDWAQSLIVGNAAIVSAGSNGSVNVYANADTDLVIDINGYYAAAGDLQGNTALGAGALASNSSGSFNTATGGYALASNTSGSFNTATGGDALENNTTGSNNTASGGDALENNTTGNYNTASGNFALQFNTTGAGNTAAGFDALIDNVIGNLNSAFGATALGANTTGSNNTAVGYQALNLNTTGNNNIAIGNNAALNVSSSNSNNIHIGSQGSPSDGATIRIGTPGTQTSFFAAGVSGVTTSNNDAIAVVIDSKGQLGTVSSSRRFKEDIEDMGDASSGLLALRPVTFRYQKPFDDGSKPIQYGLIAEEVEEVYPDLVAHSADGQIESVKYQVLDSMLLNELQKEHQQVQQQAEDIRQLRTRLTALEQLLSSKVPPPDPARQ
jgi:Chaperone of endosialidase